ncbi:hypothetical protein PROVRUST_07915 [Providencia rustigianii DSM 4541]|uniref:Uncharacterized protein n=1 Tax=Providencia rustigianii DSM 4541 TaxID=500637 RepID=D1P6J2_9GAMM|nr:hypothetical protein PROVRUST_07915 [Providencia rustigianii DSM 4541]
MITPTELASVVGKPTFPFSICEDNFEDKFILFPSLCNNHNCEIFVKTEWLYSHYRNKHKHVAIVLLDDT